MTDIKIPCEVADGITLATLEEHYRYILQDQAKLEQQLQEGTLEAYQEHDFVENKRLLLAFERCVGYFGGVVEDGQIQNS